MSPISIIYHNLPLSSKAKPEEVEASRIEASGLSAKFTSDLLSINTAAGKSVPFAAVLARQITDSTTLNSNSIANVKQGSDEQTTQTVSLARSEMRDHQRLDHSLLPPGRMASGSIQEASTISPMKWNGNNFDTTQLFFNDKSSIPNKTPESSEQELLNQDSVIANSSSSLNAVLLQFPVQPIVAPSQDASVDTDEPKQERFTTGNPNDSSSSPSAVFFQAPTQSVTTVTTPPHSAFIATSPSINTAIKPTREALTGVSQTIGSDSSALSTIWASPDASGNDTKPTDGVTTRQTSTVTTPANDLASQTNIALPQISAPPLKTLVAKPQYNTPTDSTLPTSNSVIEQVIKPVVDVSAHPNIKISPIAINSSKIADPIYADHLNSKAISTEKGTSNQIISAADKTGTASNSAPSLSLQAPALQEVLSTRNLTVPLPRNNSAINVAHTGSTEEGALDQIIRAADNSGTASDSVSLQTPAPQEVLSTRNFTFPLPRNNFAIDAAQIGIAIPATNTSSNKLESLRSSPIFDLSQEVNSAPDIALKAKTESSLPPPLALVSIKTPDTLIHAEDISFTKQLTIQSSASNSSQTSVATFPTLTTTPDIAQTINTPLGSRGWNEELSQKIIWLSNQHNQSAELHLNPPDLGPLKVQLNIADNQLTILFNSPHNAVREAIENSLPKLRESLAENNIALGNATVSDQSPREQRDERFVNQRFDTNARQELTFPSSESSSELPAQMLQNPNRQHTGILDTYA